MEKLSPKPFPEEFKIRIKCQKILNITIFSQSSVGSIHDNPTTYTNKDGC